MMKKVKSIAVVGAGLVGSLVSIYLAKRGYEVTLFERRSDGRTRDDQEGRSINLALSKRGWLPLKELGIEQRIEEMVIPMRGRMMHDEKSLLTFQPYGRAGQAINSISREGLNELLLDEAEKANVYIQFDTKCLSIDFEKNLLFLEKNDKEEQHKSDLIIGADGAFSIVRRSMQRTNRFNYSQHFIEHGYKELTIPPKTGGGFSMERNALHIWPRGNYMLIALPNLDGSFTCTLFFPYEGDPSFSSLSSDDQILQFFKSDFPDVVELMPSLLNDYHSNPTSSLVTIKCYPWVRNRTLLIGDSSHAIVPFYGQGMNSGFEDCQVLNGLLDEHHDDWDVVLETFQKLRKPDTDAISDLALQNFIEMRDLVGDEDFLLRKKIEARLADLYPEKWVPLYSMVTFNEHIRYSEALERGNHQRAIMDKVMKNPEVTDWEKLDFKKIVSNL